MTNGSAFEMLTSMLTSTFVDFERVLWGLNTAYKVAVIFFRKRCKTGGGKARSKTKGKKTDLVPSAQYAMPVHSPVPGEGTVLELNEIKKIITYCGFKMLRSVQSIAAEGALELFPILFLEFRENRRASGYAPFPACARRASFARTSAVVFPRLLLRSGRAPPTSDCLVLCVVTVYPGQS